MLWLLKASSTVLEIFMAREFCQLPLAAKIVINNANPGLCFSELTRDRSPDNMPAALKQVIVFLLPIDSQLMLSFPIQTGERSKLDVRERIAQHCTGCGHRYDFGCLYLGMRGKSNGWLG